MKLYHLARAALLLLFMATSCRQQVDVNEPPEILYGQDVCDRCNMIINEERFAAAYWTADGQARRFDDIGGMLAYYISTGEEVATLWVHDYFSLEWLQAEEASFALNLGLATPMGFDIVASSNVEDAHSLAHGQEGAIVLDFDSLLEQLRSGALELDPAMSDH